MKNKRLIRLFWAIPLLLPACLNIGGFEDEHFNESFTGALTMVPSLPYYSSVWSPTIVNVRGDGERVVVVGITGTDPLPIGMPREAMLFVEAFPMIWGVLHQNLPDEYEDFSEEAMQETIKFIENSDFIDKVDKLTIHPEIAGMQGKVLAPNEIELNSFPGSNDDAKLLQPKVTGKLYIDGPAMYTPKDSPIEISVNLRQLLLTFARPLNESLKKIDQEEPESPPDNSAFWDDLESNFGAAAERLWPRRLQGRKLFEYLALRDPAPNFDEAQKSGYSFFDSIAQKARAPMGESVSAATENFFAADENETPEGSKDKQWQQLMRKLPGILHQMKAEVISENVPEDLEVKVWHITFDGQIITPL